MPRPHSAAGDSGTPLLSSPFASFLYGVILTVALLYAFASESATAAPPALLPASASGAVEALFAPPAAAAAAAPCAAAPCVAPPAPSCAAPPPLAAAPPPRPAAGARFRSVASFRDPAFRCTANPFLAGWRDADFAAAAEALVAWRGTVVQLTHEDGWLAHRFPNPATHKPYMSLPRTLNSTGCARYGGGAGGKWVCDAAALAAGCTVYSLGSDGEVSFEAAVGAAAPGCTIHTLDCTLTPEKVPRNLPPRTHFHPLCMGSDDAPDAQFRSLRSIMRELGHTSVEVLKVDIEGFEYRLVEALMRTFLEEGDAVALPWQLLMEQHYLTNTEVGWGKGQNPGLSAGDMAILWLNLADMGYVLVHREDQAECGYCTELVALRVFC